MRYTVSGGKWPKIPFFCNLREPTQPTLRLNLCRDTHAFTCTHHGCYSVRSPPACCPGRSTPWPGSGSPVHTPWCLPGPSSPGCSPLDLPRAGCSLTSSPLAGHCTCHRGSTGSHSKGTFACSCTCLSSCFSLSRSDGQRWGEQPSEKWLHMSVGVGGFLSL